MSPARPDERVTTISVLIIDDAGVFLAFRLGVAEIATVALQDINFSIPVPPSFFHLDILILSKFKLEIKGHFAEIDYAILSESHIKQSLDFLSHCCHIKTKTRLFDVFPKSH